MNSVPGFLMTAAGHIIIIIIIIGIIVLWDQGVQTERFWPIGQIY